MGSVIFCDRYIFCINIGDLMCVGKSRYNYSSKGGVMKYLVTKTKHS